MKKRCTCSADPADPFAFSFPELEERQRRCPVHGDERTRRAFVYEKGDVTFTPPVGGMIVDDSGEVHPDDADEREVMERGARASQVDEENDERTDEGDER